MLIINCQWTKAGIHGPLAPRTLQSAPDRHFLLSLRSIQKIIYWSAVRSVVLYLFLLVRAQFGRPGWIYRPVDPWTKVNKDHIMVKYSFNLKQSIKVNLKVKEIFKVDQFYQFMNQKMQLKLFQIKIQMKETGETIFQWGENWSRGKNMGDFQ